MGVVVAVLALVGGGLYAYYGYAPAPERPPSTASATEETLEIAGLTRTFAAYRPANLPPGAPLLLMLHGSLQDGEAIRSATGYGFEVLADRHGFAGYSNGGHMALRLATEAPDRVAGLAMVAASLPTEANNLCGPLQRPIPALTMSGTADPINPYSGGEVSIFGFQSRGNVLSAADTARELARVNGILEPPTTRALPHQQDAGNTSVVVDEYRQAGKASITQYTVVGGGHVVPNPTYRFMRILGPTTHNVDAPSAIWDFFSAVPPDPRSR